MKTSTKQSSWIRGFLAVLFFQLGLALPLHTQASIHDILVTVGKLGPVLNSYIKPLQLEWLAPLEQAITTCSFGSDKEITQCADKILSSDAAKDLGGAQTGQIKSMLEIYLDVREGDIGELFNDVIQLAAGQSPLDLACSVVTIIAGGFPVCDVLKALYEVAKAAYAAAKALVGALADLGCAFYSLLGGSCGSNTRKVNMDEFAAQWFLSSLGLAGSLPVRLTNKANWDKHKADAFAAVNQGLIAVIGDQREIGWKWYTDNVVYPEWDKIVQNKLFSSHEVAYSALDIGTKRATLLTDTAPVQQTKIAALLNTCTPNEKIIGDKIDEWKRERNKEKVSANGRCAFEISIKLLWNEDQGFCQGTGYKEKEVLKPDGMIHKVRGRIYTCDTLAKKSLCTSAQKALGVDTIFECAIIDTLKTVDERTQAQVAVMNYAKTDPFSKASVKCSYNLLQSTTSIGCDDPTYVKQCNAMLQKEFGKEFGLPKTGVMDCQVRLSPQEKKWAELMSQLAEVLTPGYVFNLNINNPTPSSNIKYRACKVDAADPLIARCPGDPIAPTHSNFKLAEQLIGKGNASECTPTQAALSPHWVDKPCVIWDRKDPVLAIMMNDPKASGASAGTVGATLAAGVAGAAAASKPPLPVPKPSGALSPLPQPLPKPPPPIVPTAPAASATQLKPPIGLSLAPKPIEIDDCSKFLGRTDELLCNTDRSFAQCKPYVDSAKLKSCRRTGVIEAYQKR